MGERKKCDPQARRNGERKGGREKGDLEKRMREGEGQVQHGVREREGEGEMIPMQGTSLGRERG